MPTCCSKKQLFKIYNVNLLIKKGLQVLNPFTGEFMVTVSDINGLFFLFFLNKIYSKTGI